MSEELKGELLEAVPAEVTIKLDEEAAALLLNIIAKLDRLAAALEQSKRAEKPRGPGPYLEGNGE